MKCLRCQSAQTQVMDSRQRGTHRVRRRLCKECRHQFFTTEWPGRTREDFPLLAIVQKKSGKSVEFDGKKLMQSMAVAIRKSRRSLVPLEEFVAGIEQDVIMSETMMTTQEIGRRVLAALKEHDQQAYLRYASVYMEMESLADFQRLLDELKTDDKPSGDGDAG